TVRAVAATIDYVFAISDKATLSAQSIDGQASATIALDFNACCVDAAEGLVAVGSVRGAVHLYTSALAGVLQWQAHASSRVMHLWVVGGNRVLTSGVDLTLKEWVIDSKTATVTLLRQFPCPSTTCVSSVAFGPNRLFAVDGRGNVAVFALDAPAAPLQVLYHAHGKDVVSSAVWHEDKLYTTGHDGYINTTELVDGAYVTTRRQSVKGLSTLKRVWFNAANDLVVFGFHATTAHVVNVTQSFRRLSLETGGWRRPHALVVPDDTRHVLCLGIKDAVAVHASVLLPEPGLPTQSWHGRGHHSKAAYCVAWAPLARAFVSGGEDNALKVYAYDPATQAIACVDSVSMHITNVRAVAVSGDIVVSAGGKQAVHVWRLGAQRLQHVTEFTPEAAPQDQRFLAVAALKLDGRQLLLACSSEGAVTALVVDGRAIRVAGTFGVSKKPILSCGLFHSGTQTFLATGATDGNVVVWDLSVAAMDPLAAEWDTLKPAYIYKAHDMGVNCLSILAASKTAFHVVSGGDDQCIAHAIFTVGDGGLEGTTHGRGVSNASASALKAIQCVGDVVVAAGYDQRVTVWGWNAQKTELSWSSAALVETADIAGLGIMCEDKTLHIAAVGKGLQMLTLR
ncbi:hypothetical protein ACHHYP_05511, partial [Achlya hypogyna]